MYTIKGKLSFEGKMFLDLCLRRDPSQRPDTKELLKHEYFVGANSKGIDKIDINISNYINNKINEFKT